MWVKRSTSHYLVVVVAITMLAVVSNPAPSDGKNRVCRKDTNAGSEKTARKELSETVRLIRCFYSEVGVLSHLGNNNQLKELFRETVPKKFAKCPEDYLNEPSIWLISKIQRDGKAANSAIRSVTDYCKISSREFAAAYTEAWQAQLADEMKAIERGVSGTINLVSNIFSKHADGHYDHTEDAFAKVASDWGYKPSDYSEYAQQLMAMASVHVDEVMWKQIKYHAHTPYFDFTINGYDRKQRAESVESGKELFRSTVCWHAFKAKRLLDAYVEYNKDDARDQVLYHTGVLLHLVQDLVYHKGMTLRQHAGLQFILEGQNPDVILDPRLREITKREAIDLSVLVIDTVLMRGGRAHRDAVLKWVPDDPYDSLAWEDAMIRVEELTWDHPEVYSDGIKDNQMRLLELISSSGYLKLHRNIRYKEQEIAGRNIVIWQRTKEKRKKFVKDVLSSCQ